MASLGVPPAVVLRGHCTSCHGEGSSTHESGARAGEAQTAGAGTAAAPCVVSPPDSSRASAEGPDFSHGRSWLQRWCPER